MARKKNTGELEDRSIETKLKHKKEKKKFEKMNKALINYGTWSNGQTLCEFRISERDEKEIRAEKIYEDTSILNVKKNQSIDLYCSGKHKKNIQNHT